MLSDIMKKMIKSSLRNKGFKITRIIPTEKLANGEKSKKATWAKHEGYADFDDFTKKVIQKVKPYTLTPPERISETIQATKYIIRNNISGALVECGVWMGGNILAIIETLKECNINNRDIYLYDTFNGMSEPTLSDVSYDGQFANKLMENLSSEWCKCPLEAVTKLIVDTGYPKKRIHYVQGKVEETIPQTVPDKIALLRLDTDWYESTIHELTFLYPILVTHGALIIDDYGHWKGARKAVDEYFGSLAFAPFLGRTDYSSRICIKPHVS